ncbi:DUF4386 domain-containing protein [Arthrobacter sp. 08Y14]|uniref:DUF4386 domain-containing protein n=1 Tax=Arthrobacter sp. 08Y14 TaxID=2058885 RepID=UPI0021575741|nr:DUF4386 domain-containing protein [Arthrobacter sp. 08Y14]
MQASNRTARIAGILFVLTFISAITGAALYAPLLTNPDYLTGPGADTRILLGAVCELVLIITNIGTAVVLFPVLRRYSETAAIGYLAARIVECTFIAIGILSLLAVVTLRQIAGADAAEYLPVARGLVAVHGWTFLLGPGFVVGIGNGLLLGFLMYRSHLVPRPMALFGLVGGPLMSALRHCRALRSLWTDLGSLCPRYPAGDHLGVLTGDLSDVRRLPPAAEPRDHRISSQRIAGDGRHFQKAPCGTWLKLFAAEHSGAPPIYLRTSILSGEQSRVSQSASSGSANALP